MQGVSNEVSSYAFHFKIKEQLLKASMQIYLHVSQARTISNPRPKFLVSRKICSELVEENSQNEFRKAAVTTHKRSFSGLQEHITVSYSECLLGQDSCLKLCPDSTSIVIHVFILDVLWEEKEETKSYARHDVCFFAHFS